MESKASSHCLLLAKGASVNARQAGLLSAELALVLLMWGGMTHANGTTADRDKVFHCRVRNTGTKMKTNKCIIKASLEDSVVLVTKQISSRAFPDSC